MGQISSNIAREVENLLFRLKNWWQGLIPGDQVFWPILWINIVVWMAWKVPCLKPTMLEYFISSPFTNDSVWVPLLLSTFSHIRFLHLLSNMDVLYYLIPEVGQMLNRGQLIGLYLSSALVSSSGSYLNMTFMMVDKTASLGASGAIMGIIGFLGARRPNVMLGPPILSAPGYWMLYWHLSIDVLGLLIGWITGWRMPIDFAAHLCGCLFGAAIGFWTRR